VISVVIVDDQHLVRAGVRALLERAPDIEVVGEGVDGESGMRAVVQFRPDVVLMDVRMPGLDGVTATRRITADPRLSDVAVVVLTTFDADEHVFEAIRSGALVDSCSRTPSPTICVAPCGWWRPADRCSRRR
jgi:DNA-binding NarL/FixJ family response regulator